MQEGMIGFMRAIRTYREGQGAEFATYARVCIDNSILSSLRSARVAKRIPTKSLVSIDEAVQEEARPWKERLVADKADNPEFIFIAKEEQKRMEERLNIILSPLERNALFLYLSGCNYEEIGRHLSTTPKTVDNALQRVRRKLKQKQSS